MTSAQVAIDPPASQDVFAVVAADERGALEHAEVRLDGVEPGGLGRGEHERYPQAPGEGQETRVVVHVAQVVEDDVEMTVWIAGAQATEGLAQFAHAFAFAEHPGEHVGMDIEEAQEGLGPAMAVIGRAHPHRLPRPAQPADRAELERAPLVEADDRRAGWAGRVEGADAPPFGSKSGSLECFQVRMRLGVRPSRRRSRRTHSSLKSGMSRFAVQYSRSVRTDQVVKGRPSSAGLESATSMSSRSCLAVMIGTRPRGLETASKVRKPLRLKRRTHAEAVLRVTPTRSADWRADLPARTSAMTRYRWCTRAGSERVRSLVRKSVRSARSRGRKSLGLARVFLLRSPDDAHGRRVFATGTSIKLEKH